MNEVEYTKVGVKVLKGDYEKLRTYADKNGIKVYYLIGEMIKQFLKDKTHN